MGRYTGPCLLEAIDSLQAPQRDIAKPLRMPICDVIRSRAQGHVSASGKLEAGAIRDGTKVQLHLKLAHLFKAFD